MAVARATAAFEFVKGEDAQIDWTIYTTSAETTAQDVTGWTFEMVIKRQSSDTGSTQVTTSTNIVSATAGTVSTTIASSVMDDLEGDYQFDFWRTNSGASTCLCMGTFSVLDSPKY